MYFPVPILLFVVRIKRRILQENGRYDILEAVKRVSMYNIPSVDKGTHASTTVF